MYLRKMYLWECTSPEAFRLDMPQAYSNRVAGTNLHANGEVNISRRERYLVQAASSGVTTSNDVAPSHLA